MLIGYLDKPRVGLERMPTLGSIRLRYVVSLTLPRLRSCFKDDYTLDGYTLMHVQTRLRGKTDKKLVFDRPAIVARYLEAYVRKPTRGNS